MRKHGRDALTSLRDVREGMRCVRVARLVVLPQLIAAGGVLLASGCCVVPARVVSSFLRSQLVQYFALLGNLRIVCYLTVVIHYLGNQTFHKFPDRIVYLPMPPTASGALHDQQQEEESVSVSERHRCTAHDTSLTGAIAFNTLCTRRCISEASSCRKRSIYYEL